MYMDDIKLLAKHEKELETLIHAFRIYSQYIEIEFGIEKCAMLVMKSGERHMTDEMELTNQDKIRTLGENEIYKQLGYLRGWHHQTSGNERQNSKGISQETRKLLETKTFEQKPHQRNKYLGYAIRNIFRTLFQVD